MHGDEVLLITKSWLTTLYARCQIPVGDFRLWIVTYTSHSILRQTAWSRHNLIVRERPDVNLGLEANPPSMKSYRSDLATDASLGVEGVVSKVVQMGP